MNIKLSNIKIILIVLLLLPTATTKKIAASQFNVKLTGTHHIPELHAHITLTKNQCMLIGNDIPGILTDRDICAAIRLKEGSHSTNISVSKLEIPEDIRQLLHQVDFKLLVSYAKPELEKIIKNVIDKKMNISLTSLFAAKTSPQTLIVNVDFDLNKTRYTHTMAIKIGDKLAIMFSFCTPKRIHAQFTNQFELLVKNCTFDPGYAPIL